MSLTCILTVGVLCLTLDIVRAQGTICYSTSAVSGTSYNCSGDTSVLFTNISLGQKSLTGTTSTCSVSGMDDKSATINGTCARNFLDSQSGQRISGAEKPFNLTSCPDNTSFISATYECRPTSLSAVLCDDQTYTGSWVAVWTHGYGNGNYENSSSCSCDITSGAASIKVITYDVNLQPSMSLVLKNTGNKSEESWGSYFLINDVGQQKDVQKANLTLEWNNPKNLNGTFVIGFEVEGGHTVKVSCDTADTTSVTTTSPPTSVTTVPSMPATTSSTTPLITSSFGTSSTSTTTSNVTTEQISSSGSTNVAIIVGAVVGVLVAIVIAVACCIVVWKRKKRKAKVDSAEEGNDKHTSNSNRHHAETKAGEMHNKTNVSPSPGPNTDLSGQENIAKEHMSQNKASQPMQEDDTTVTKQKKKKKKKKMKKTIDEDIVETGNDVEYENEVKDEKRHKKKKRKKDKKLFEDNITALNTETKFDDEVDKLFN